jgi:hypothetical protein
MSKTIPCPCGRLVPIDTSRAAERVRCPGCQALLDVPVSLQMEAPLPETVALEETLTCPSCRHQWPPETVLCVQCGYNFRTGKKLKRKYQVRDETVVLGLTWLGTYDRFTVRRDKKGRLELIRESRFLWIPFGTAVIPLKDYDAVATDYELRSDGRNQYDYFFLELQGRGRPYRIWSGGNEGHMHALVDLLKQVAGLTIKRK